MLSLALESKLKFKYDINRVSIYQCICITYIHMCMSFRLTDMTILTYLGIYSNLALA